MFCSFIKIISSAWSYWCNPMSLSVSYNPTKNVYNIKQNDQLVFVYDRFNVPPFWEYKFDEIPELVKKTDLNEDVTFRKKNEPGNKKTATILDFEFVGKYEILVTHQNPSSNEKFVHRIKVNVSHQHKGCAIL